MSQPRECPLPQRPKLVRTGPSVLLVAVLVGAALVATINGRSTPTTEVKGPPLAEIRRYPDDPNLPITYEEARKAGTIADYDWGDRCDTTRRYDDTDKTLARLAIPSTYAPPCVPVWGGKKPWVSRGGKTFTDNGGSTARGVTAKTIKVVFYQAAEQDIAKQLQQFGVQDSDEVTLEGVKDLIAMGNGLYETYGRRVELIPFQATGDGRSPSAAKADAVKVAEMGAFASIGGPSQTTAYQHELARQGVLCIACGYAATDDVLNVDAPYAWGYLATPDQILFGTFGFGTNLLYGQKATFAGDPAMRRRTRKFGIVHYEQDPPIFGPLKSAAIAKYAKLGISVDPIIQYVLDPNSLNSQAQAIIGRLKRDKVTSVVFLGDPLMPRLLTQQATRQDYFPEWLFTGTAFTDTTSVARLYDRRQMAHAFGASSAPARTTPSASESWKLYRWWFGHDPTAKRTMVVWDPVVQILFLGIHMAGPDLRAETFAGGLFRYPPTGATHTEKLNPLDLYLKGYLSGDTTPAISFGFHRGPDEPDFVAIDDFTSVWWDDDVTGPDEAGRKGKGMWQYTGLGLRMPLDNPKIPAGVTENFLFNTLLVETGGELAELAKSAGLTDLRIAAPILTETPKLNVLPNYEPWPESPNAKGR
ncbi:MAG: hypothetical protein KDB02_02120 [Acidimicrobiales bacterium]|nr:hypothetical protein [Acidimicrobiales bacterium]